MATLTDIESYIRSQSLVESDDLDQTALRRIINRGYRELAALTRWPWLIASTTLTVTAGTSTVALPADFKAVRLVNDEDGDEFVEFSIDFENDLFELDDAVDVDTDFDFEYFIGVSALNETSNTTPLFEEGFHYILGEYALWKVHQREEMYQRAEVHKVEYFQMLATMRDFYSRLDVTVEPFIVGQSKADGTANNDNLPFLYA